MPGGRTVTLAQLRTDARLYADQRATGSDQFLTDTEVNRLINQVGAELYGLIVQARGDEETLVTETLTTTIGSPQVAPSNPFWSIVLVWHGRGTQVEFIPHCPDLKEWLRMQQETWTDWGPKCYRVVGTQGIVLAPTPNKVENIDLYYIPPWTDLVNDGDTFDGVNGWEKLVALGVAIEMRMIEESPFDDLLAKYSEIKASIEEMAADRAANDPEEVRDVQPHRHLRHRSRLYGLGRP